MDGWTMGIAQDEPDEQTRLIQPTEDAAPVQRHTTVVDHQRMKERFGTIVRSKEGKMVSVNAPLPFNLHNKPVHRVSASASASTSQSRSNRPPATHGNGNGNGRYPSPHRSIDTAQSSSTGGGIEGETDESGGGIRGGDGAGRGGSRSGSANGIGGQRGLGLSLKLVNGSERQTSGTRGRGRRVTPSGLGSGGAGVGPGAQAPAEGDGGEDCTGPAEPTTPSTVDAVNESETVAEDTPPKSPFTLKVGSISRSWGE
ncbi:uncharacterized protein STEHIDRAFT_161981 [Stereum hirsutum FP-91666 SS1]|uniref:uncharacterized protein n=1 Tax=Stereum hirsutum (strain FP-91666) TaxID=721885 RepID=UPI000444990C|nr:uncharacterized protein STEHIDRAFT_161981 [Stereum hirsutum FP-91666 SS1]EIM80975.1 hypothetical protein STEHIDRAFT_161981 [Stereum hirsutum FP-91666 SS1]